MGNNLFLIKRYKLGMNKNKPGASMAAGFFKPVSERRESKGGIFRRAGFENIA